MLCFRVCACWEGAEGPACGTLVPASERPRPNGASPIGVGLSGIAYFTTEQVFVDAMKQSSEGWISNCLAGYYSWDDPQHSITCKWDNGMPKHIRVSPGLAFPLASTTNTSANTHPHPW